MWLFHGHIGRRIPRCTSVPLSAAMLKPQEQQARDARVRPPTLLPSPAASPQDMAAIAALEQSAPAAGRAASPPAAAPAAANATLSQRERPPPQYLPGHEPAAGVPCARNPLKHVYRNSRKARRITATITSICSDSTSTFAARSAGLSESVPKV